MYIPEHFALHDKDVLHAFMRAHAFATLVTSTDGVLTATHLPFMIEEEGGEAVLRAHMARANAQWREFDDSSEVMVIFQGAHAYVSPTWYANPGPAPTWNYSAVHAYGTPRIVEDADAVRALIARLVGGFEDKQDKPWRLESLADDDVKNRLKGIVVFEIPITRLEGKAKLDQNRNREDRLASARGLRDTGDADAIAVADLMDAGEEA